MSSGATAERPGIVATRLRQYTLHEELGKGGMGIVYRARDERLQRWVALKVLPRELAGNPRRDQRLIREARLASSLNHPNIVTIHDIAEDGGRWFLVMELVDGNPLKEHIPEDGLELSLALRWTMQIADAMAAAHEAGIIHRDLKPQNLLVVDDGGGGRVKVLDFGIAKLDPRVEPDLEGPTLSELTVQGETPGTLAYMSPEQIRGEALDSRSDIFSLGVVSYEMLTGRRPFEARSAVGLAHAVYFSEPDPVRRHRPDVPPEVDALLGKMLSKQRQHRPATMRELHRALAGQVGALDGSGGLAEPSTLPPGPPIAVAATGHPRAPKRAGPRRRLWVLTGLTLIGLTLGFLGSPVRDRLASWFDGSRPATPQTSTPQTSAPQTSGNEATSLHTLYLQGLDHLEHYYRAGSLDAAIESFQRLLARDPGSAAAHAALARTHLRKFTNDDRDPSWRDKALAHAQRAIELDETLATAHASLGLVLVEKRELEAAERFFEQALHLDPFHVEAYRGRGKIHELRGEHQEAEAIYRRALEIRPDDRRLHDLLGSVLYRAGRYAEAETAFLRSTELAPDSPMGHRNLAAAYHMQGKAPQAADQLQRAIEIRATTGLYTNLGTLYFYQGLYQEALAAFERAIDFPGSRNNPRRWANLGDAYRYTPDNQDAARQAYLRAIQLLRDELAEASDDPERRSRLALLLAKRGDCGEATSQLSELEPSPPQGILRFRMSVAYELCGRRDDALRCLAIAIEHGYSLEEIGHEPDLLSLRDDLAYHQLLIDLEDPGGSR